MRVEEAIKKYTDKFGGFPMFLMMGAEDEYIIEKVEEALRTGEEITADEEGDY